MNKLRQSLNIMSVSYNSYPLVSLSSQLHPKVLCIKMVLKIHSPFFKDSTIFDEIGTILKNGIEINQYIFLKLVPPQFETSRNSTRKTKSIPVFKTVPFLTKMVLSSKKVPFYFVPLLFLKRAF